MALLWMSSSLNTILRVTTVKTNYKKGGKTCLNSLLPTAYSALPVSPKF